MLRVVSMQQRFDVYFFESLLSIISILTNHRQASLILQLLHVLHHGILYVSHVFLPCDLHRAIVLKVRIHHSYGGLTSCYGIVSVFVRRMRYVRPVVELSSIRVDVVVLNIVIQVFNSFLVMVVEMFMGYLRIFIFLFTVVVVNLLFDWWRSWRLGGRWWRWSRFLFIVLNVIQHKVLMLLRWFSTHVHVWHLLILN